MELLSNLEILQIHSGRAAVPCLQAVDFAAQLALKSGASVWVEKTFPCDKDSFTGRGKLPWKDEGQTPQQWAQSAPNRVLLIASADEVEPLLLGKEVSAVELSMESWQTETTLFAESALADLLGDPEREPLVPRGPYASGTIGYAVFTALMGVWANLRRHCTFDVARVNGLAAMSWVNWKAAAAGFLGNDIHREGKQAEWPILPCKDGFVAFVFTERDWDSVVAMVADDRLHDPLYATFALRQENREAYMNVIGEWATGKTKAELENLFYTFGVPGAAVSTLSDLLNDELLEHREAFVVETNSEGRDVHSPVAPHRVANLLPSESPKRAEQTGDEERLPLAGIRVLDFGIITAGAGTTGLLADMGAEVIKVESPNYPDPFRSWAGSSDSPLFNFNNRNKYGIALDLKTETGKTSFLKLAETADVVVENFRRGVLERMGLTLDVLREANSNILLVSVSGQGLDGPGCDHTTFGSTLEASSGFAALTCYDDGVPYITGRNVNYPDQTVCFYAAAMVVAGVVHCQENNCAAEIDVSQRDVAIFIAGNLLEQCSANGTDLSVELHTGETMYRCSDGRWVSLGDDAAQKLALNGDLHVWTSKLSADEVVEKSRRAGVVAAKALYGSEMYAHPTIEKEGVFCKRPDGTLVKGFPFQFLKSPMTIWGNAPKVGEHTDLFVGEE